jgi:chromosome segregation ATPase
MNHHSSRSHAILQIEVEQLIPVGNSLKTITSLINFVDLAGSERVTQSKVVGKNFNEMTNINLSLSTLSRVIHAVVKKQPSIPIRESCLTKLLKDSFGGNSLTWVIATVSGESIHANETSQTLKFADITRQVKCIAKVNELDRRLDLEDELRLLKTNGGTTKQIQQLQQQLAEYDISYNLALTKLEEAERMAEDEMLRRIEAESKHAEISDKFNELTQHVEHVRKNLDIGSLQERAVQYEKKYLEVSEQLATLTCLHDELQRQLHEKQTVFTLYNESKIQCQNANMKLEQMNGIVGENTALKEQVKQLMEKVSSLSNEQGQNEVLKEEIAHGKTLLTELREKIKEIDKRHADKELQTNTKIIRSIKTIFDEIETCAGLIEQSKTVDEAVNYIRKLKINISIFRQ